MLTQTGKASVTENIPLVLFLVRQYGGVPPGECADLIQEGVLALCRAVDRFNPSVGGSFSAYAALWIRGVIWNYNRVRRMQPPTVPIDEPIVPDGSTLADLIEDDGPSPCDLAEEAELRDQVRPYLEALSGREKAVIELYYGFRGKPHTLAEIGMYYGVTRERIRQVKREALDRLREAMERQRATYPDKGQKGFQANVPQTIGEHNNKHANESAQKLAELAGTNSASSAISSRRDRNGGKLQGRIRETKKH